MKTTFNKSESKYYPKTSSNKGDYSIFCCFNIFEMEAEPMKSTQQPNNNHSDVEDTSSVDPVASSPITDSAQIQSPNNAEYRLQFASKKSNSQNKFLKNMTLRCESSEQYSAPEREAYKVARSHSMSLLSQAIDFEDKYRVINSGHVVEFPHMNCMQRSLRLDQLKPLTRDNSPSSATAQAMWARELTTSEVVAASVGDHRLFTLSQICRTEFSRLIQQSRSASQSKDEQQVQSSPVCAVFLSIADAEHSEADGSDAVTPTMFNQNTHNSFSSHNNYSARVSDTVPTSDRDNTNSSSSGNSGSTGSSNSNGNITSVVPNPATSSSRLSSHSGEFFFSEVSESSSPDATRPAADKNIPSLSSQPEPLTLNFGSTAVREGEEVPTAGTAVESAEDLECTADRLLSVGLSFSEVLQLQNNFTLGISSCLLSLQGVNKYYQDWAADDKGTGESGAERSREELEKDFAALDRASNSVNETLGLLWRQQLNRVPSPSALSMSNGGKIAVLGAEIERFFQTQVQQEYVAVDLRIWERGWRESKQSDALLALARLLHRLSTLLRSQGSLDSSLECIRMTITLLQFCAKEKRSEDGNLLLATAYSQLANLLDQLGFQNEASIADKKAMALFHTSPHN